MGIISPRIGVNIKKNETTHKMGSKPLDINGLISPLSMVENK